MSRVQYNGRRLIPAPLVTVSKEYQSTEDGTKVGSAWNLTIDGTIVAFKGSPVTATSGSTMDVSWWTAGGFPPDDNIDEDSKLRSIMRKQEAIRELFSEDGYSLEFQSEDGSQPMKCNPRINSVVFQEGPWVDRCQYSVICNADVLYANGTALGEDTFSEYISTASEQWQIETNDEAQNESVANTYRITHSISAKGKRFFNNFGTLEKPAWEQARDWVSTKMGFDSNIVTNSLIAGISTNPYNHIVNETIDEFGGTYSITESWILATEPVTEAFEVSTNTTADNSLTTVTIQGSVTGLRTDAATKYQNASTKYAVVAGLLLTRCQTYSGLTLNITPTSTTVGKNPVTGVITYSNSYNDRPSVLIAGAKSETINVSDNLQTDYAVPIFVLGRTIGPVIQDLNTSRERTRTLTIEAVMPVPTGDIATRLAAYPDVSSVVSAVAPTGTIVKVQENSQGWDIINGRFTRNVTWIWEP